MAPQQIGVARQCASDSEAGIRVINRPWWLMVRRATASARAASEPQQFAPPLVNNTMGAHAIASVSRRVRSRVQRACQPMRASSSAPTSAVLTCHNCSWMATSYDCGDVVRSRSP